MSAARKAARLGRFIVLEGLDGAGTTTQTERLASALRAEGHAVVTTREPSDGPVGTMLRQALTGRLGLPQGRGPLAPETLALLFAADRTDHLHARVLPALEEGKVVLCDRYVLSSLAYQGASLPMAWVDTVNAHAVSPDLTLFVGVDPRVAAKRRAVRGGAPELFEADEAQRRIAKQYLKAITLREKRERIVRIDGELSVEAVTDACLAEVRRLFARKR
ncbi:dTMP kinase [Corallococcus aberystwythensis]|uniref:Thymidylate kinase n=1 Tax=Corallococcus aberystwythensis TaxID=2316722 RepID=A0A3A8PTV6_9BACT|nr:dTMP kinase [Corallococcus aberystwythensis]RKH58460.1 dTMP kinase [Corallococcus aberystwythensis]